MAHQRVSGRVVARDDRTGEERIVADAGDYIYPADLRTNSQRDRLFVKASGLAGGLWHETWLFEYDIVQNHQTDKVRVKPSALPPECPAGPVDR